MKLLFSLGLVYATVCLVVYLLADRMTFLPPPATYRDSDAILKLQTADGVELSAVHLPNPAADYTVLYSHGNAEDLGVILPMLARLRASGFAVFAYDYRGYGTSRGTPSAVRTTAEVSCRSWSPPTRSTRRTTSS